MIAMRRQLLAALAAFALAILALMAAPIAIAQMNNMQPIQIPQPQSQLTVVPLHCGDFQRHADGTWSPLHPVIVPTRNGPMPVKEGANLREGSPIGGTDVAATLNKECLG
jgi:hypothetical protein